MATKKAPPRTPPRDMAYAELVRCFGEERAGLVMKSLIGEVWVLRAHNQHDNDVGVSVYVTEIAALLRAFEFIEADIQDLLTYDLEDGVLPFVAQHLTAVAESRNVEEMRVVLDQWNEAVLDRIYEATEQGWLYNVELQRVRVEGQRDEPV